MQELDGEANAFSRVRQTQCEVEQSTTRCNTSTEREESKAQCEVKKVDPVASNEEKMG